MEDLKFAIPQEILDQTVEAMQWLQTRLEIEAASYSMSDSRRSKDIAEKRLEQAEMVQKLFEFYIHL